MAKPFNVLHVDLEQAKGGAVKLEGRETHVGGSGLAALLFERFGRADLPPLDPAQPLIFAIGPLSGYFPLMSKAVCSFISPYTGHYAESHAGGRLALALRFTGYDGLVVTGAASKLSVLVAGAKRLEVHDVHYMRGMDVFSAGKLMRRYGKSSSGHRSTLRIGPAGENLSAFACINVDTYRHFGRLGCGAVMGAKNLKGIVVQGDSHFPLPPGKEYPLLYKDIHKALTTTDMMRKYHDLGTPVNMAVLNELKALPWRNMSATTDPEAIKGVSGEAFAEQLLLRQTACSGCPVGCIHIGLLRRLFAGDHDYLYRQVSYDHETVFSEGAMLGMTRASKVLALLDETEKQGLDAISAGVALAWATEALEKGLITEKETLVRLRFDDLENYLVAINHLGAGTNEFYSTLAQGTMKAAEKYGGQDFACVLGQEMAGYATGEVFFVSQALGFRHSHLDAGGYSYDQKSTDRDADKAVAFLMDDEKKRVKLCCMVSCLFARSAYTDELLLKALESIGFKDTAASLEAGVDNVRRKRWRLKFACGFRPEDVKIPKRFTEIETWKGVLAKTFMDDVRNKYIKAIRKEAGLPNTI